jgi:large subunit ribosomal protein L9
MKGKTQKLLLNESVKHVGRVGDVVEVSSGYARNFLIPRGIAVAPTPKNLERVESKKQEAIRQEAELRAKQEQVIAKLATVELAIERRANEQGHLYGSVSATEISKALAAQGFEIEPSEVFLPGKIDKIDVYTVDVGFDEDLRTSVKVYVSPDAESKADMEAWAKEHPPVAPKPAAAATPAAPTEADAAAQATAAAE